MAIPDNYIDKITKDGESRMISPAADNVRVDNEHYKGGNLDEVLDEIEEKVSQAGTGNYTKPSTGIPKSDMESAVQTSLGKADSAVQGVQINGGLILPKVNNNVDIFVPTKTSQLQNDSDFITEEDLPEGVECDTQMSSTSVKPVQNKVIKAYVDNLINGLIDGAPAALDTLKELATALGNNSDAIATIINTLSSKANASEVVKSISVNGTQQQKDSSGNVDIQVEGGGLTKEDISVETQGDGTVKINVGSGANKDTYTINLNHTHEDMAKLIVCEESDLPSTLDPATIYAISDSGETEIKKLIIRGMEFAGGGGTPSTEPKIVSPIGTQIDFNGESTKTVTVRATNLSEALTIAVTGVTANLQTVSANDAANGVQLTLTKGQNFETGALRIYSSEVDKSWTVIESQDYSTIAAVKFTKQQYVETDIHPGPATRLEIDMQFDGTFVTPDGTTTDFNFIGGGSDGGKTFSVNSGTVAQMNGAGPHVVIFAETSSSQAALNVNSGTIRNRSTLIIDNVSHQASFNGGTVALTTKTTTMPAKMKFGSNSSGAKPFGLADIILYSLKHYESNVLKHEYLPKTYNGVAGLYDTVTNTFISSATGTPLVAVNE